ncbi:MAG: DUF3365 domain-containing protein [Bacteroidales bacterium]|jgi:hypothetical protein|nr:DUF3365 domain-containing protein [Bacteroidales bacterium]
MPLKIYKPMAGYKNFLLVSLSLFLFSCQDPVHKNSLTPEQQAELIAKGKKITMLSFKALSGEVIDAINEGGVQNAVGYCHVQASPLIDSLSKVHQAKISRVSDRYRNPQNKPGELDLEVIHAYQKQLAEGSELQPHLEVTADEVIFYSPILILNPLCLNCHGEPGTTLEQANLDFIRSKYPDDRATGYKLGDLRGVWKIMMSSEF